MKVLDTCKIGAQLLGTATVKMVVGGVITAIMPPEVSVVYKTAVKVGSWIAAGVVSKAVDNAVNETFDNVEAVVNEINNYVDVLKQKEPEAVSNETSEEEDGE